ncbi:MAG TPA: POTRA domain-containing protein [Pirellulales bacterium]|nr:POTRA domain-containing protein [Pirellulales bacterium]
MVDARSDRYRFVCACAAAAACWTALACVGRSDAQYPSGGLEPQGGLGMPGNLPPLGAPGMTSQGPGGQPLPGGAIGPKVPSTTPAPATLLDPNRGPLERDRDKDDGPRPEEMPGSINQGSTPGLAGAPATAVSPEGLTGNETVVDVRVDGHKSEDSLRRIQRRIRTRVGRRIDRDLVEKDVRSLHDSKLVLAPVAEYQRVGDNGVRVIYHVIELPTIKYVKYYGNTIKPRRLNKKVNLKEGDPLNAGAVEEARVRLVEYYQEKGFVNVKVDIKEGTKPNDRGVKFLINEGPKQKIWKVTFEGNTIASDSRLQTQIESKKPILYLFKGEVDAKRIDEDVVKLENYYRSLGFFRARIGRELIFDEQHKWLTLNFVIDEGPRYVVRNVVFAGQEKISAEELRLDLRLEAGQFYDEAKVNRDLTTLKDKYGAKGYVFAAIDERNLFQEEPGELDVVYRIREGKRFAVGPINIKILGDNPHTRRNTILNRLSVHPGDVMDTREIRASERRLKFAGIFMNNPAEGTEPKILFKEPEVPPEEILSESSSPPRGFRGQSPDGSQRLAAAAARPRGAVATSDSPSAQPPPAPRNSRGFLARRGDLRRGDP